MILFIFEGEKREPKILETIKTLFFPEDSEETIIVSYCNNIYHLYSKLAEANTFNNNEIDIESVIQFLREDLLKRHISDAPIQQIEYIDEISQVFLFFDYDGHNSNYTNEELNNQLCSMLQFFDNESVHGKLYISYPMIESLYDTFNYKDKDFNNRKLLINDCINFKSIFSNYDCLTFDKNTVRHYLGKETDEELYNFKLVQLEDKKDKVKNNWQIVIDLTVNKVLFLCGKNDFKICSQFLIFSNQWEKYICIDKTISVLNGFPLFLKEYFKGL